MKIYCSKCDKDQEIIVTQAGPHLKASCVVCRKYIKFMSKEDKLMLEEEEEMDYEIRYLNGKVERV